MSGKVTMRTQKLGTCLLGRPHWIAGRWRTSVEKEKRFLEGQSSRHLSQTPSDLRQELLSSGIHEAKSFQSHWKKNRGSSRASCSFVCLPSSCSLSRTWPRRWHSVGGKHYLGCQPQWHPMWRCVLSSKAAASNHRVVCRHREPNRVVPLCWERPCESASAR